MNHNVRFECNGYAVAVVGIIAGMFATMFISNKSENRKKAVEIHKIETELRLRDADITAGVIKRNEETN